MSRFPLELGDGVDDVHGHRPGGTGQVDAAQGEAMDADTHFLQFRHGRADIDRVSPKTVELGDGRARRPFSILSMSRENPSRCAIAIDPEMVSVTIRCGSMPKPAASISRIWFTGVCSAVETRA